MGHDLNAGPVLVADGAPGAGLGHAARCTGLAWALRERGVDPELFALGAERPITLDGLEFMPSAELPECADRVLVVDSYRLPPEAAAPTGSRLSARFFDGVGPTPRADLVISFGPLAPNSDARALCGPRYACLRPSFWPAPAPRAEELRSVLVSVGASDAAGRLELLVDPLRRLAPRARVTVVKGPMSVAPPPPDVDVLERPRSLREALIASDLVVCAGGQTMLEALACGRPCLAVAMVDNQRPQVESLLALGAVAAAEPASEAIAAALEPLLADERYRERLAARAREAIDGQGARRVARELLGLPAGKLHLRPARRADSARLRAWRNDPDTRRFSRSSAPVDVAEHERWLESTLAACDRWLLIGEQEGAPVGQVRFDLLGDAEAEISVSLDPARRGRGLASELIVAGCDLFAASRPVEASSVIAEVRPENVTSLKAFERAGFKFDAPSGGPLRRGKLRLGPGSGA